MRHKTAWAYEEHEPQSSTGLVFMHGHHAANRTANAEGMALTQQPGPNIDWHTRSHASLKQWHVSLLASQNKTFFLAELGTMGSWGWVGLAMGLGLVLTVIIIFIMSSGTDKRFDRRDFLTERGSMWPSNVNTPRPSARFGPRASVKTGQRASLLAGATPRGSMMGERFSPSPRLGGFDHGTKIVRHISDQSLGPTESYPVQAFTAFARSSQHITTVPESNLQVSATASSSILQPSNLDVGALLCAEFVVPPSCECNLRVTAKVSGGNSIDVTDANGYEVMRIIFLKQGGQQQILLTGHGDMLAQCRPALGTCGEFHVLRAHGEYFGKLVEGSARDEYLIQTASSVELTFRGSAHTMNITDTGGRLLAMTEPEIGDTTSSSGNEAYLLRVAPLMDMSIVMCGLLIINHLM